MRTSSQNCVSSLLGSSLTSAKGQERTSNAPLRMSAQGQKPTCASRAADVVPSDQRCLPRENSRISQAAGRGLATQGAAGLEEAGPNHL